jgi:hypothetical protein
MKYLPHTAEPQTQKQDGMKKSEEVGTMAHLAQICTGLVVISIDTVVSGQKADSEPCRRGLKKGGFVGPGPMSHKGHIWIRKLDRMCPGLIWPKQTQEQGLDKKTGNQGSRGKRTLRGRLG